MRITTAIKDAMLIEARMAYYNAFVHKASHKVGAALLGTDGRIYAGCNTQNSISGLGQCAERNAVDHACLHGQYIIEAILVYSDEPIWPCGACLQYLCEFSLVSEKDIKILIVGKNGKTKTSSVKKLLPHGYKTHMDHEVIESYREKSRR